MTCKFYVHWENEYSKIVFMAENPDPMKYSGPFKSLTEAKQVLIEFLQTKLADTKNNLLEVKALRPGDFQAPEEKVIDLL